MRISDWSSDVVLFRSVLICHALTGDQYVASDHPGTGKPGWWVRMVGPGKPIDTDRFHVICANVLGSCMGTSGPATPDAATGAPLGMAFPVITINDMRSEAHTYELTSFMRICYAVFC